MPGIGEALAQLTERSRAFAAAFAAQRAGHRGAVLHRQHHQHQRHQEPDRLQQRRRPARRHAEKHGDLGQEITVDRDVGEPAHPDEGVVRVLVADGEQAKVGGGRRQNHARDTDDHPGDDAGVDQRQRDHPRHLARLDQRQHRVARRDEACDGQQIHHRAGDKNGYAEPDRVDVSRLQRAPRPAQQKTRQPFAEQAEDQNQDDLPDGLDPQRAGRRIAPLIRQPADQHRRIHQHPRGGDDCAADLLDPQRQRRHDAGAGAGRCGRFLRRALGGDHRIELGNELVARGLVLQGFNQRAQFRRLRRGSRGRLGGGGLGRVQHRRLRHRGNRPGNENKQQCGDQQTRQTVHPNPGFPAEYFLVVFTR